MIGDDSDVYNGDDCGDGCSIVSCRSNWYQLSLTLYHHHITSLLLHNRAMSMTVVDDTLFETALAYSKSMVRHNDTCTTISAISTISISAVGDEVAISLH